MIHRLTQEIVMEKAITHPNILFDADGPGTGNSALIIREERPKEGGLLLHLHEYKYPYQGIPQKGMVEKMHLVKRVMFHLFESCNNRRAKIILGLLMILPYFLKKPVINLAIDYLYGLIEWVMSAEMLKPHRYCKCCREIHRTFGVLIQKNEKQRKLFELIRDVVCMFLESDSAYRFRFQDIMAEARIKKLLASRKIMIAEVKRLFDIFERREWVSGRMNYKFEQLEGIMILALRFGFIKKIFQGFFQEAEMKEIRPDEADRYFNSLRFDYHFEGKEYPERMEWRKQLEGEKWHYWEEVADGILNDYYWRFKKEIAAKKGAKI